MKKLILVIVILSFISCKKESQTEVAFRIHLKETLKLYQDLCLSSESRLEQRESDEERKRQGSDKLLMVQVLFKTKFEKTKIIDQTELLKFQSKLYSKFNLLYPYHKKYENEEASQLVNLNTDILKLYLECNFYKTQYENLEYQGGQWVAVDGIHIINPSQVKKNQALDLEYSKAVKSILKKE